MSTHSQSLWRAAGKLGAITQALSIGRAPSPDPAQGRQEHKLRRAARSDKDATMLSDQPWKPIKHNGVISKCVLQAKCPDSHERKLFVLFAELDQWHSASMRAATKQTDASADKPTA